MMYCKLDLIPMNQLILFTIHFQILTDDLTCIELYLFLLIFRMGVSADLTDTTVHVIVIIAMVIAALEVLPVTPVNAQMTVQNVFRLQPKWDLRMGNL